MTGKTFELMRVWAMLTGMAIVALYFALLALQKPMPEVIPMLAAAIAGFEMMLFGQEIWFKRGMNRG